MHGINSPFRLRPINIRRGSVRIFQLSTQPYLKTTKTLVYHLRSFGSGTPLEYGTPRLEKVGCNEHVKLEGSGEERVEHNEPVSVEIKGEKYQHLLDNFPESKELQVEFKGEVLAFFNNSKLYNDKASFLVEIAKRRFFQPEFSHDVYKAFVIDIVEWVLDTGYTKNCKDGVLILSYMTPAIFKATYPSAAGKYIWNILEHVGPVQNVYQGVLISLRLDQVPSGCTEFAISLLEKMVELNMRPSSEAFGVVIYRLLSEAKGRRYDQIFQRALSIYKESLVSGLGDPMICFRLINAIQTPTIEQQIEIISWACVAIEQGFLPLQATAKKLLRCLYSIAAEGTDLDARTQLMLLDLKWDGVRINTIWNMLLLKKNISLDKCFLVLASSYFKLSERRLSEITTISKVLNDWKKVAKLNYKYIFSMLGVLGRKEVILDILCEMEKEGISLSTESLNGLILFSNISLKHTSSLQWFVTLTKAGKTSKKVSPDSTTYALIHHSAFLTKDFKLGHLSFKMALSERKMLVPACYSSLLDGVLASAVALPYCNQEEILMFRLKHIKKANAVLWHALDNGYRGSTWSLYCKLINIHICFLNKIPECNEKWIIYEELIQKVNALFCYQNIPADEPTYCNIFQAMSKLVFLQNKAPYVIKDLKNLYRYMVASGTQLSPYTFSHLFNTLGAFNHPELSKTYFLDAILFLKSGKFLSFKHEEINMAFEAYLSHNFLTIEELGNFVTDIYEVSYPSPRAMLTALTFYHSRKAPLTDLKSILFCFCKQLLSASKQKAFPSNQVDSSFFIKICDIFFDSAGCSEMVLALDYVMKHTLTQSTFSLDAKFFCHIITKLLSTPNRENFDHVLEWLAKMKAHPSSDTSKHLSTQFRNVEALFPQIKPTSSQREKFVIMKANIS